MAWETVAKKRFPPFFGRDADFPDGSLQPERYNKAKRSFVTLTLRKNSTDEDSTATSTQRSSEVTNRDRKRHNGSLDLAGVARDRTPEELLAATRSAPHGNMPDFSLHGPQVHGARHKQQGSLLLQSAPAQIRSLDSAGLTTYSDSQPGRLASTPNGTRNSASTASKTVAHIPPLGRLSAHHDSLDVANIMSNNNGGACATSSRLVALAQAPGGFRRSAPFHPPLKLRRLERSSCAMPLRPMA
ncbi:hypothetical protein CYMTET_45198 [Cymbomonas tetramitiformis]|uniref:Uncharacterized protein n=1 Tax=Cymbomonas tetramitiformis TaxID=36881 RepID=A0AAE0BZW4_9CHLO|nr:hypothetical protein CYMTET_45198 [Cymbomonas tetramitiformis]